METNVMQMIFGSCYLIGVIAIWITMETKNERVREIAGTIALVLFVAPVVVLIVNLLINLL